MRVWLCMTVLALGCGKAPPAEPITVTPTEYDAVAQTETDLAAGGLIDLVLPPQGGFVLFVGARAANLGEDTVELTGRLVDQSGALIGSDARTVAMQPDGDARHFTTDLRSYTMVANIAVCPSSSTTDRFGATVDLEVVVTEPGSGRSGSATVPVVLACRQSDPMQQKLCQCECAGNYFLGKCTM